jgi:nucleoside-diphosphate-sugar epimerase
MPRRVAVTGATGFIGGHVVQRLGQAGWQVRALTRRLPVDPLFRHLTLEAVIGSLADQESLAALVDGVEAVVHLAGLVKARSRTEFFEANAVGAKRLVAAALQAPQRPRLVLLSSLAAREPQISDYAASKRAGEQALENVGRELPWTILRPPAVYGPGDRETLAFFRAVRSGWAPLPAVADARLSLIHADDLAAAIVELLDAGASVGATYEIDDGRSGGYRWAEMVAAAGRALGVQPRIVSIPPLVLRLAAGVNQLAGQLTGKSRILTPGKAREMLHADWTCHDRRMAAATSWRPAIGIDKGFAETTTWYRRQGWL